MSNDGHPTPIADGGSDPPTSTREWIKRLADEIGDHVDVDDLLIQSKRRDPMMKGTDADHAKAQWFAKWWRRATEGRVDGDTIHVRGVHYFMYQDANERIEPPTNCSWNEYRNTEKCYDYLESAAVLARILGYVPLDGLADKKHGQRTVTTYGEHRTEPDLSDMLAPTGISTPTIPDPDDRAAFLFAPGGGADGVPILRDASESFADYAGDRIAGEILDQIAFDHARQAPYHLELWSEKTLPGYITDLANDYGVNVVVEGEGDLSLTIAHDLVQRISHARKPAIILYLSDFDPKGDNMAAAMASKIAWLKQRGDIDQRVVIEQLAVTKDQIEQYDLPRQPIDESTHTGTGGKAYDTLVTEWEQRRGAGATELNTLEADADLFKSIVAEGLSPYVDESIREKNARARESFESDVREAIVAAIQDADLEDARAALEEWCEEFNARFEEAEPVLQELNTLVEDDDRLERWREASRDAINDATIPAPTVPEGEGAVPDDPLYDTERNYVENVVRVEKHRNGDA